MTRAIFPGSFDPFTIGHENVVRRALGLFDEVVVAVGVNADKQSFFSAEKRLAAIDELFADEPKVKAETYTGLTLEHARRVGATHILRGIRNSVDLEFERAIAQANYVLSGIDTIFLVTEGKFSSVSSSIVRDIVRNGGDASIFIPEKIRHYIQ